MSLLTFCIHSALPGPLRAGAPSGVITSDTSGFSKDPYRPTSRESHVPARKSVCPPVTFHDAHVGCYEIHSLGAVDSQPPHAVNAFAYLVDHTLNEVQPCISCNVELVLVEHLKDRCWIVTHTVVSGNRGGQLIRLRAPACPSPVKTCPVKGSTRFLARGVLRSWAAMNTERAERTLGASLGSVAAASSADAAGPSISSFNQFSNAAASSSGGSTTV